METERLTKAVTPDDTGAAASRLRSERVWRALAKASFAVLSFVTPAGEPRSSGVVYTTVGRRLYVATAADSWKARQLSSGGQVAVTVPVRRGGILALFLPIPPATISFHARVIVYPAGPLMDRSLSKLASLVPPVRRVSSCVIEIVPEGHFLTYGLGVSLKQMATSPAVAGARAPVS